MLRQQALKELYSIYSRMRKWREPSTMSIETLYKLYKTPLFSLAYRMLGSVMDAEDIVQEAFLAFQPL
nr:sigma factor [Brevibacillus sp. RS1.1]